jgi:hypothetical protein
LPKLEEFLDFGKALFQENMTLPSASDWEKIMGAEGQPHESLLLLFFPSGEVYYDETGKNYTDEKKYSLVWKYEEYNRLNDEASALIGDPGFRYRRPGFLTQFSDKAYVQVFRNLEENRHLSCPSWYLRSIIFKNWPDLLKLSRNGLYHLHKNVSAKIKTLLQHVVAWVEPRWTMPVQSSKRYKAMQWHTEVKTYVFRGSTLSEGGTRPWQGELTDSQYAERSRVLIEDIWNEVATRDYWKENSILLKQVIR